MSGSRKKEEILNLTNEEQADVMKKQFIFLITVLALICMAASPVDAKNIIKIGKDISINSGQVVNNAFAIAGQITVSGLVEKNVTTVGGSIVLTGEAVVRGNVTCIGGVVVMGNGAQVYGNITEINSSNISTALASLFYGDMDAWDWLVDIIYFCFFAMIFMLALMLAFLFPRPLNAVAAAIQGNKTKSFFWGALATLMIVPFFMLLVFSFVGIPLIPFAFAGILLAFMFGFIGVSSLMGRYVLTKVFRNHKHSTVRETLFGLILLWLMGWIPFYLGMIFKAIVITIGFGGVLLAVFHHRHRHHAPPAFTGEADSSA